MKKYLYCVFRTSEGSENIQQIAYGYKNADSNYSTEENARKYVQGFSNFLRYATKGEYEQFIFDRCFKRIKKAFEENNLKIIWNTLSVNDNIFSMRAFQILSGVKLAKTWKVRQEQLKEYYGQKYIDWLNQKAEAHAEWEQKNQLAKQARLQKIEKDFLAGEHLSGIEFLELCDKHGIKLAGRTKGYCKDKLYSINICGKYRTYGGKSQSVIDAFFALKKILGRD